MNPNSNDTADAFLEKFRRARNAGTPIMAIGCFDPAATMTRIQQNIAGATDNGQPSDVPIIRWDIIDGWTYRNAAGKQAIEDTLAENVDQLQTINPTESLKIAQGLPEQTILFMLNAHHNLDRPEFLQALWNLRDVFKSKTCSLCLIGPDFTLPEQLQSDIYVLDEPLPTDNELREIILDVTQGAGLKIPAETVMESIDALRGLAAFPAEQSVAMNMRKAGLDVTGLWERKEKLISSTPGLKVYSGKEKFDQIGGCDQIKRFMRGVITGKDAPNVIVFLDEGEKMFAGATGDANDSSGVAQDQLGTTLSKMEDNEWDGAIFYGPPGAAKSAIAKATGNEAGVPTIMLDLGGLKGGLVGKSEAQLRNAYKVIEAVGGGKAFFIMTCNKIVDLPPELRRRFTSGIFFFDLPTRAERDVIWPLYLAKYGIPAAQRADVKDEGWTGAEIRNCCRTAYRQGLTLAEAATYIVPVSRSAAPQIQALRKQASGAYLSANEPGVYTWESPTDTKTVKPAQRQVHLED